MKPYKTEENGVPSWKYQEEKSCQQQNSILNKKVFLKKECELKITGFDFKKPDRATCSQNKQTNKKTLKRLC